MASSTSIPSTRDVVKALKTLNLEKTRNLVFHLGVPPTALDDIKDEFSGDTRKQKYVEKWLDIDTSASWEKLVSGLREIDMTVLAAEVESASKTPPPGPASYTYTIPFSMAQPISAPAQLEAAPLDLQVIASTPALTPTPANSQVLAVSEARVEEVRASIEDFKELFTDLTVDVELDLVEKEDQDRLFFKRFQSYLLALPAAKEGVSC